MAWDYWQAVFGGRDEEAVAAEAMAAGKTVRGYVHESVALAAEQDHEGTFDAEAAEADIVRQVKASGLAVDQRP